MAGLLHPKNFAPNTGGSQFKEGYVRVDTSSFKVIAGRVDSKTKVADPDFLALVWSVTRLDENLDPMTDESENPLTEDLQFSLGKKTLASVHPGGASSIDDDEIEDMGVAVGTSAPKLFLINTAWQLHPNSGCAKLMDSLANKVDEKYLDRVWAPDWEGMVCLMKSRPNEKEKPEDLSYNIKYVDKVVKMGGGKAAAGSKTGAAKGGSDDAGKKALTPILEALSQELDGEKLTFKALQNRVSQALKKNEVDSKLHVPALALLKDEAWLKKNGPSYDMTVDTDEKSVVFGTLKD